MAIFISISEYEKDFFYELHTGAHFFNSRTSGTVNRIQAKIFIAGKKLDFIESIRIADMNTRVYRIEPKKVSNSRRKSFFHRLMISIND